MDFFETETFEKIKVVPTGTHTLVLHNDDYNSMEWVIACLMEVCKHSSTQAEQCALITHNKGRCEVKVGSQTELQIYQNDLLLKELTVTIEKSTI